MKFLAYLSVVLVLFFSNHFAGCSDPQKVHCHRFLCQDQEPPSCSSKNAYPDSGCTCVECPVFQPQISVKNRCLTQVLNVCPGVKPPPPTACPGVCSGVQTVCSDPGAFPDSACACVPCVSAAPEQLACALQKGFCRTFVSSTPLRKKLLSKLCKEKVRTQAQPPQVQYQRESDRIIQLPCVPEAEQEIHQPLTA